MSDQPSFIMGDAPYLFQNQKIQSTNYVPPACGQIYAMQSQGGNIQPAMVASASQPMMVQGAPGGQPVMIQSASQPVMIMGTSGGPPMMMGQPNQPVLMQGAPGRYGGTGGLQPQGYYPPSGQPQPQPHPHNNQYPPGHPQYNTANQGGGGIPAGAAGAVVGFVSGGGLDGVGHVVETGAVDAGGVMNQQWNAAQPGLADAGQQTQAGDFLVILPTHTVSLTTILIPPR